MREGRMCGRHAVLTTGYRSCYDLFRQHRAGFILLCRSRHVSFSLAMRLGTHASLFAGPSVPEDFTMVRFVALVLNNCACSHATCTLELCYSVGLLAKDYSACSRTRVIAQVTFSLVFSSWLWGFLRIAAPQSCVV